MIIDTNNIISKLGGNTPKKVKSAIDLIEKYCSLELPNPEFSYGIGINPKEEMPFIALTDDGSFVNFIPFVPWNFARQIHLASFGSGNYVGGDTNVIGKFDERDFLINYLWLIESENHIDEAISEIDKIVDLHPRFDRIFNLGIGELAPREELEKHWSMLDELEQKYNHGKGLSSEDLIKYEQERNKHKDLVNQLREKYVPKLRKDRIKIVLTAKMKRCKSWLDKYLGFSDEDFTISMC